MASLARRQLGAALMAAGQFGQIMKSKLSALSGRYLAALRRHLKHSPHASLEPARGLGRQAAASGLETLDVARIHQRALAALEASCSSDGLIERADIFFTETITPIEQRHLAAREASARLKRLNQTLGLRTVDLAASKRLLKEGIAQRKTVEVALKKSAAHYKTLLAESRALQARSQLLVHQILSAQEDKRKRISHELQDEIAQTLCGINVRLLTVAKAAVRNDEGLKKEIVSTQRLVDKSVNTIKRFARELGQHRQA
jgi:signal transduction histidine kinase